RNAVHAGVQEPVPARKRDVPSDGPADQRDDLEHTDPHRHERAHGRLADGRTRGDGDEEHEPDHHDTEHLGEAIHGAAGLAYEEQGYRYGPADGRADSRIDVEQRVGAEPGAGNVADVEDEAAEDDEQGEEVSEAREDQVRDVLRPSIADRDDTPDVELRSQVEDDGHEDGEA